MGYWSEHPMAGDTPLDYRDELLSRYDINNTVYYEREVGELKYLIENDLISLIKQSEEYDNFTLPFIIIEYKVKIPNKLIARIKKLIGDGRNNVRGYIQPKKA